MPLRLLLLAACAFALGAQEQIVDRVVRYVNADIITASDVRERARARAELLRQRGEALPADEEAWRAFQDDILDELTKELLFVQEADRLQIPVDERPLQRQVRTEAHRHSETLAHQSRLLAMRIRQQKIRIVQHFYTRVHVSPQEVATAYAERKGEFMRPARFHPYRILLRPSSERERELVREALLAVFRQSQVDPTDAIAAVVTPELRRRYLDQRDAPAERFAILREVARGVLDAAPADPPAATQELVRNARAAIDRAEALRDEQTITATLEALRDEMLAIEDHADRTEACIAAARRISEGPKAEAGGDLGWQEPGALDPAEDAQLHALEPGGISPVFSVGAALAVLYLADHEPARQRTLAEVSAELRQQLEDERRAAALERLTRTLEDRAHIKDLDALSVDDLQEVVGTGANAADLSEGPGVEVLTAPDLDRVAAPAAP